MLWEGANRQKHGDSFKEAKTALTDEFGRLISDPDHSEEEDRFILIGTSIHSHLLVACHCVRDSETIRIISARKANRAQSHKDLKLEWQ
ncbi:BrnT family toxin [Vreelandella andesensis]|uniref:BrnT family toxin n=1 Tax=Vreelandella andesensis TaxID=447567 RepID=UPI001FC9A3D8|nr:BrnT family toxin [Halomonas andesensis]